ncbi:MAG: cyclic nucleotide-binding domain-containing protein [Bacteriovoracaceae bacterium]|nr:cyclic nucleotide-binding domain-containing protein [Bacteriovoracaceae bacterium]
MPATDLVKGCPLFYELYDDEISEIIKSCHVASYKPGDYIIKQGDTGTEICVVLSGLANITIDKSGTSQIITTISKGDFFGELVLINETKRTANIIAVKNTDILVMTYANFYSFYKKNPDVFSLMVLNVTRLITKRLKNSNQVISDLSDKLQKYKEAA